MGDGDSVESGISSAANPSRRSKRDRGWDPPLRIQVSVAAIPGMLDEAASFLDRFDRPDLALVIVETILGVDPDNASATVIAGLCAHRLGDLDIARSMFDRATALAPDDPEPRRLRAAISLELGLASDAVEELNRSLVAAGDNPSTYAALGDAYAAMGKDGQAVDAYRSAIALGPRDTASRKKRILLELKAGRLREASAHYQDLLALDSQNPAEHLVAAGRFLSVADWCREHGAPYTPVAPAMSEVIYPPRYIGQEALPPVPVTTAATYVAEIQDVAVIGGETMLVAETGEVIWDLAAGPGAERFDLAERVARYAAGGVALVDAQASAEGPIEAGIAMTGVSSHNYFHWLVEFLPRFATLEAASAGTDIAHLPLLVDRAVLAVPQLVDALRAVAGSDREIIGLDAAVARRVERLVVAGQSSWMPNNLRDGESLTLADYHVPKESISFLRRRLPPAGLDLNGPGHRRLYLAKRSGPRRLSNGADLHPVLAEFGIETVWPEVLSLADQIRLFADAELVVSESGAALTNLIFCPPSTRIVVLMGDRWEAAPYSQIAGVLGQSMAFVTGTLQERQAKVYQSRFALDPRDLARALSAVFSRTSEAMT